MNITKDQVRNLVVNAYKKVNCPYSARACQNKEYEGFISALTEELQKVEQPVKAITFQQAATILRKSMREAKCDAIMTSDVNSVEEFGPDGNFPYTTATVDALADNINKAWGFVTEVEKVETPTTWDKQSVVRKYRRPQ